MKRQKEKLDREALLALVLLAVFAVCVLTVLLTGAKAYSRLTQRDRGAYQRRTAAQYIATRARQADGAGAVSLTSFGEGDALTLDTGEWYVTRIYYYDGYLMELYTDPELGLGPEDGEKVLALSGLSFHLEDGFLDIACADSAGRWERLSLCIQSEGGGGR